MTMPDPHPPASCEPDPRGDHGVAMSDTASDAAGRCRHEAEPPDAIGGPAAPRDFVAWATLETALGPRRIMPWTKRGAASAARRRR